MSDVDQDHAAQEIARLYTALRDTAEPKLQAAIRERIDVLMAQSYRRSFESRKVGTAHSRARKLDS